MDNYTLTFDEKANGWTSFYSFVPDMMVSLSNDYYSFKNGQLYRHNIDYVKNTFYGVQYPTEIEFSVNEAPSDVKIFKAVKLESTSSNWNATINTNLDSGYVNNFIKKESFKYGDIKRQDLLNTKLMSVQGIGELISIT